MDVEVEPPNDSEELIKLLGDRIEDLERILIDDEDFCNKDIDATYQAALKYTKSLEEKCHEKLNELKIKLDQIRGENLNVSKQNKKQFDDEIDDINLLFSSGKHQEGLEDLFCIINVYLIIFKH
jgi:IMP dehydrogenase/GMP reductase